MNTENASSLDKTLTGNTALGAIRLAASVAVLLALAAGYLASQYAYFSRDDNGANQATEWARFIDSPIVSWAALAVLIGSIALSLIPDRGEKP